MTEETVSRQPSAAGEIVFFEAQDGGVHLDVRLEHETVWLSLGQMAELFQRDKSVISRHLRSVFASGELTRNATVAKNATVRREGNRQVVRASEVFNLDAILSVGYRVNSRRGTQFRIWATRTLRDHLVRGYTLNERRLRERGFGEIEEAVALLARTLDRHALVTDEGRAVLDVVQQYTRAWRLLLEYDEQRLPEAPAHPKTESVALSLQTARTAMQGLREALAARGEATGLFGEERGEGLASILAAIEQTFCGEQLYPGVDGTACPEPARGWKLNACRNAPESRNRQPISSRVSSAGTKRLGSTIPTYPKRLWPDPSSLAGAGRARAQERARSR